MQGLVRIAAAVPHLHLANPQRNLEEHLRLAREAREKGASVVCFPELSLTGATCGDLLLQQPLLKQTEQALCALRDGLPEGLTAIVGAPVRRQVARPARRRLRGHDGSLPILPASSPRRLRRTSGIGRAARRFTSRLLPFA